MYSTRNCFLTVVIVIECVLKITGESCPYEANGLCHCAGKSLKCYGLQAIPQLKTGNDVILVDKLQFQVGQVTSIPGNSLPPGLVKIDISWNPIVDISGEAFVGSATTLSELSIDTAKFTRLPDALRQLTNLTHLEIINTYIQEWNNATLAHLARSLHSLVLVKVGLSAWPNWFSIFHSLRMLNVSDNDMKYIPDDAFISLNENLEELNFAYCNLTNVPNALSALKNLTSLDLNSNIIQDVDGRPGIEQLALFPCADTLLSLTIKSTKLNAVPKLSNMTKLSNLDLSYNKITNITSDAFPSNLRYLDLSNNSLTEITETSFSNSSLLETLILSNNPISNISRSAFTNLVFLIYLDLSHTYLLPTLLFLTPLNRLKTLIMPDWIVNCTCPPHPEIIYWYDSYNGALTIQGFCRTRFYYGFISGFLNVYCRTNVPTIQTTKLPTTQETRSPITHETKSSTTQETKSSTTQETNSSITQQTNSFITQETKSSTTQETKSSTTQETNSSITQQTNSFITQETKSSTTQETKSSTTQETNSSITQETKSCSSQESKSSTMQDTKGPTTLQTSFTSQATSSTTNNATPLANSLFCRYVSLFVLLAIYHCRC